MKTRHQILCILALTSMVSGCAGMILEAQERQRQERCEYESAYTIGLNSGKGGEDMERNFAELCPEAEKANINRGYREGFILGMQSRPTEVKVLQVGNSTQPGWQCKESWGKKDCGFGCASNSDAVRCAKVAGNNCIEYFGKFQCGTRCRTEYGRIVCDQTE